MVSIVIVSHSAKLAEGVRELALQMVQGQVAIAAAGGIDDPENPIGTDAMRVYEAIESVYSDDGVVLLMDLGSAILSAETALEFLTPAQQAKIYLCEAPFVEGTLAAAVQASVGAGINEVLAEARGALEPKVSQLQPILGLGERAAAAERAATAEPTGEISEVELTIHNRLGLHARPAALFVSTANRYQAEISVGKGNQTASAKSINQVATLGVRQGDQILVRAAGIDAAAALTALQALVADDFGEAEVEPELEAGPVTKPVAVTRRGAEAPEGELWGIPASPGIAIGPVIQYRPRLPEVTTQSIEDPAAEWRRLRAALAEANNEISDLHQAAIGQVGPTEAAIFEAHRLFLQDPALVDVARETIFERRINAEAAWQQVIDVTAEQYRGLEDAYMQARAADVIDVGLRVLRHLLALELPTLEFPEPSILVAADLTPSDTARMNPAAVLAICTQLGGATSHSAILARGLGIPAVVGLGPTLETLTEGQMVAVDGSLGKLWLQPGPRLVQELGEQRSFWLQEQERAKATSQALAITQDGRRIEVAANIGGPHDAPIALDYGAEGVGLFRTEFLFLDRVSAPTEEEQYQAYLQVAEIMGQRPVIIRTLDVGGDKPLPYLDLGHEENPFLGWRGIRFCLDQPEIFKPQLRAALRASYGHNIKLMFPMIGATEELVAAKGLLNEARRELTEAGIPFDPTMEVGIMIEVPSAVAIADHLAAEADFFSIGTNDLTQYVMAADRGNPKVAGLANALQPAVLRLVKQTVDAGHAAGIWVGMCGELAGNPLASAVLVGLGLDELSLNGPGIPAVKEAVRNLTVAQAQAVAAETLNCASAQAVQAYLVDKAYLTGKV